MSNHLLPAQVANAASAAGQARPVAYETPVTRCANTELGIVSGHGLQGSFFQVAICPTIGQGSLTIKAAFGGFLTGTMRTLDDQSDR